MSLLPIITILLLHLSLVAAAGDPIGSAAVDASGAAHLPPSSTPQVLSTDTKALVGALGSREEAVEEGALASVAALPQPWDGEMLSSVSSFLSQTPRSTPKRLHTLRALLTVLDNALQSNSTLQRTTGVWAVDGVFGLVKGLVEHGGERRAEDVRRAVRVLGEFAPATRCTRLFTQRNAILVSAYPLAPEGTLSILQRLSLDPEWRDKVQFEPWLRAFLDAEEGVSQGAMTVLSRMGRSEKVREVVQRGYVGALAGAALRTESVRASAVLLLASLGALGNATTAEAVARLVEESGCLAREQELEYRSHCAILVQNIVLTDPSRDWGRQVFLDLARLVADALVVVESDAKQSFPFHVPVNAVANAAGALRNLADTQPHRERARDANALAPLAKALRCAKLSRQARVWVADALAAISHDAVARKAAVALNVVPDAFEMIRTDDGAPQTHDELIQAALSLLWAVGPEQGVAALALQRNVLPALLQHAKSRRPAIRANALGAIWALAADDDFLRALVPVRDAIRAVPAQGGLDTLINDLINRIDGAAA